MQKVALKIRMAPHFFSELVTDWLQTIVRDRNANPPQLPNLERIEFHHEAVVFTKKQNIQI